MSPSIKLWIKKALARYLYRYPPCSLEPERLYAWLDAVWNTREVRGAVVEIGCNLGGTAAIAAKMLQNLGISKAYVCYDTFQGFVSEQFERDIALGTPRVLRHTFSANSVNLTRKILRQLGAENVELVKADIVTMPANALPPTISAVLLDVDLSEPTEVGLRKVWPRLVPGGIVVVDDCSPEWDHWKPEIGYKRFCAEFGLVELYQFGMGMLKK